jgi:hypothetical protein
MIKPRRKKGKKRNDLREIKAKFRVFEIRCRTVDNTIELGFFDIEAFKQ